jgi:hypothetical protein
MATTCRECGAAVDNESKHRSWHYDIERQIQEALREAKRAKRG